MKALWRRDPPSSIAALLLALHLLLALDVARRSSPSWDEIIPPAAGLAQWRTGKIEINADHPILSKLISGAPLRLAGLRPPFDHPSWEDKNPSLFGFQTIFRAAPNPRRAVLLSRLPSVALSWLMCLLAFVGVRRLWGGWAGLFTLVGLSAAPVLMARAGTALLEMPLYFFLAAAFVAWALWRRLGAVRWIWIAGAAGGLALGCKAAAAPFLTALFAAELALPGRPWRRRAVGAASFAGGGAAALFLLYLPWGGGLEALLQAARFAAGFGQTHSRFYFAGGSWEHGTPLLSWAALALKAPLSLWALGTAGAYAWFKTGRHRDIWWALIGAAAATLFSVFAVGTALSTVQFSPLYLALAGLAAGIGANKLGRRGAAAAAALCVGAYAELLWVHPNPLAFFNAAAGGPSNGYKWLADSDQDWGQSLPALRAYLDKENAEVILCYSGAADPEAYGLFYHDLVSPAIVSRYRANRLLPLDAPKIYLAVGTKVWQTERRAVEYVTRYLEPKATVGETFLIYDVSGNAETFGRMAELYGHMGRQAEAQWAGARARRLVAGQR